MAQREFELASYGQAPSLISHIEPAVLGRVRAHPIAAGAEFRGQIQDLELTPGTPPGVALPSLVRLRIPGRPSRHR
jgi:hypothetical protein